MMVAYRLLARMKGLRGGPLDVFGRSAERRLERKLIADYFALIEDILARLSPANHALAVDLAAVPEHIRGYGPVKARHVEAAKKREAQLLEAFGNPPPPAAAATPRLETVG